MLEKMFMLVLVPLLMFLPALAPGGQELQDELPVGEWLGSARAGGVTTAEEQGVKIEGGADFTVNFEFAVPTSGPLEGTWTLDGNSIWVLEREGYRVNAFMDHSADGPVSGNRIEFSLGVAQIHSDITVAVPNVSTQEIQSIDPIGPIDLSVTGIYCNDAFGEWILSWRTDLLEHGFTPTFNGDWYAVRQDPEFTGDETMKELFTEIDRLNEEFIGAYENAPSENGRTLIDPAVLWGFIHDIVALQNQLRNLSPCDREFFGEDNVERWIYVSTANLRIATHSFFENLEENDLFLDGNNFMGLGSLLLGAGAVGAGAIVPIDGRVEVELQQALEKILESEATTQSELSAALTAAEMLNLQIPPDFDVSQVGESSS